MRTKQYQDRGKSIQPPVLQTLSDYHTMVSGRLGTMSRTAWLWVASQQVWRNL